MNIDANDLVAALKVQRDGLANDAAMLKAALDGAGRRIAALEAEVAKLTPKAPEDDGA